MFLIYTTGDHLYGVQDTNLKVKFLKVLREENTYVKQKCDL